MLLLLVPPLQMLRRNRRLRLVLPICNVVKCLMHDLLSNLLQLASPPLQLLLHHQSPPNNQQPRVPLPGTLRGITLQLLLP